MAWERERERREKIYCNGFVHANLFSENWPLKRRPPAPRRLRRDRNGTNRKQSVHP